MRHSDTNFSEVKRKCKIMIGIEKYRIDQTFRIAHYHKIPVYKFISYKICSFIVEIMHKMNSEENRKQRSLL